VAALAAALEANSEHPLASAILAFAAARLGAAGRLPGGAGAVAAPDPARGKGGGGVARRVDWVRPAQDVEVEPGACPKPTRLTPHELGGVRSLRAGVAGWQAAWHWSGRERCGPCSSLGAPSWSLICFLSRGLFGPTLSCRGHQRLKVCAGKGIRGWVAPGEAAAAAAAYPAPAKAGSPPAAPLMSHVGRAPAAARRAPAAARGGGKAAGALPEVKVVVGNKQMLALEDIGVPQAADDWMREREVRLRRGDSYFCVFFSPIAQIGASRDLRGVPWKGS